nr:FYN-binding protein 1-like [Tanacetum cinerariifolium]
MSNDAPKLYIHKPKKALLKKHLQHQQQQSRPSPSTAAPPPPPVAPPKPTTISSTATPMLPKESFARRYRFMWPLLLAVNFSVGGSWSVFRAERLGAVSVAFFNARLGALSI